MIPVPSLAFLDANVLFSRTLRDWICLLALESQCTVYDLRWSEDVLAEWVYRLRRKNPDHSDQAIGNRRHELEQAFPDRTIRGYDPSTVTDVADPDDRHVLAAVVHGNVDMLVTADSKAGFREATAQYGVDLYTADEFLMWAAEGRDELVSSVLRGQLDYYNRNIIVTGGRNAKDLVESLRRAGAPAFAFKVEGLIADSELPPLPVTPGNETNDIVPG